jgi:hypothetical protein
VSLENHADWTLSDELPASIRDAFPAPSSRAKSTVFSVCRIKSAQISPSMINELRAEREKVKRPKKQ